MDMRDVICAAAMFSSVCVSPSYAEESVVETPLDMGLNHKLVFTCFAASRPLW